MGKRALTPNQNDAQPDASHTLQLEGNDLSRYRPTQYTRRFTQAAFACYGTNTLGKWAQYFDEFRFPRFDCCPNCGATEVVKSGHTKVERFIVGGVLTAFECYVCGKRFLRPAGIMTAMTDAPEPSNVKKPPIVLVRIPNKKRLTKLN